MMRAVLRFQFLAGHPRGLRLPIGYSSTFLAGFFRGALVYFPPHFGDSGWNEDPQQRRSSAWPTASFLLYRCFFSFVGTILGGIWADQSWGRFWGWDPKENGALMIVLWNAYILHAPRRLRPRKHHHDDGGFRKYRHRPSRGLA